MNIYSFEFAIIFIFKSKRNYLPHVTQVVTFCLTQKTSALLRFGGPEVMHAIEATLTLTITPSGCL